MFAEIEGLDGEIMYVTPEQVQVLMLQTYIGHDTGHTVFYCSGKEFFAKGTPEEVVEKLNKARFITLRC